MTPTKKPATRGGKRPGAGRKAGPEGAQKVVISGSVTPDQKAKYKRLGASQWLGKAIDRAKERQG